MSSTLARHRKPPRSSAGGSRKAPRSSADSSPEPSRSSADRPRAPRRRRRLSAIAGWLRHRPAVIAALFVMASTAVVAAWPAAAHLVARASDATWVAQADTLGLQLAGSLGLQLKLQPQVVSEGVAVAPIYLNPLRDVTALVPERVDEGVDFSGTGPVYAIGDGVVTSATGAAGGWPGGGWITYTLTNGPGQGLIVYVAEDITPTVAVGQRVSPSTVLGYMFEGGSGIETGWAALNGLATSQLTEAAATGGAYFFPTVTGLNFDELLVSLGAPPAPNLDQTGSGILPASYPTSW